MDPMNAVLLFVGFLCLAFIVIYAITPFDPNGDV